MFKGFQKLAQRARGRISRAVNGRSAAGEVNRSFSTCGQERMIFFSYEKVRGCCVNPKTGLSPHLADYGVDGTIDIEEIVKAKQAHLATVRRGEMPKECRDCTFWHPNEWPESPYLFNDVNLGHFTACNTDCYYCRTNSNSAPTPVSARKAPRLLPTLKQMVEAGYIDPNATIRFGGGEPTIGPEFEATVNYFIDVDRRFFMNSSGVKYSAAIERMLRESRKDNRLVISVDAASNETYKLVKRLDLGARVWDNIGRYAKIGPDVLEVKYILLPENWQETGDFIRKCHDLGVRRVSFDLDSNPILNGISGSLTDEIVEGIAVLIYEGKKRGMSVYQSGSGSAVWQEENGYARVQAALARLSNGQYTFNILESGFVTLVKNAENLDGGNAIGWGRLDDATAVPLNSADGAIYLQEGTATSVHRIEQTGIKTAAGERCVVEVIARPAGRGGIMIEFRDAEPGVYVRAKYDLARARIVDSLGDNAAITAIDDEWVRCHLSIIASSSTLVLAVSVLDEKQCHIYAGTGQAGVHVRPLTVYSQSPEYA
jgi:Radical SAM superfamily